MIPVYEPNLSGNEERYVVDAIRSGWISGLGPYVEQFEAVFADYIGVDHAIAVSSGTAALHLSLLAMEIGPGDEVIVPALTFVATANAVAYTGAKVVFADVDPHTWCIDPASVMDAITNKTKAIIPVHLYGHPADMPQLHSIADWFNLGLLEDAAEAHGAGSPGRKVGAWGDAAAFSFYANKTITTGEGGIITTNNAYIANRCRHLRGQAMSPNVRYWHGEIGYNYRMTNMQAAVGVAQMECIDDTLARKRQIAQWYREALCHVDGITLAADTPGAVPWMVSILVDNRDDVMAYLSYAGIETRPFFVSLDTLPPYCSATPQPVARQLSQRGLNLPSSPTLTREQVTYVCNALRKAVAGGN